MFSYMPQGKTSGNSIDGGRRPEGPSVEAWSLLHEVVFRRLYEKSLVPGDHIVYFPKQASSKSILTLISAYQKLLVACLGIRIEARN